jgi:hypothetical protein
MPATSDRTKSSPTPKRETSRRARRREIDPETAVVFAGALSADLTFDRAQARLKLTKP